MFSYQIEPRFSETDALGHVSNTALPVWFEEARNPIFKIFNPDLSIAGWNIIIKKIDVEFVKQIFLFKPVEVRSFIRKIGNSSLLVEHEAWQDDAIVAKGTAVLVHYDYNNECTAGIPEDIRQQLNEHLAQD